MTDLVTSLQILFDESLLLSERVELTPLELDVRLALFTLVLLEMTTVMELIKKIELIGRLTTTNLVTFRYYTNIQRRPQHVSKIKRKPFYLLCGSTTSSVIVFAVLITHNYLYERYIYR